MPGSSLRVIGFYSEDVGNAYGIYYDGGLPPFTTVNAEWSILASYNQQFSETLGASIAGQHFSGFDGFPDGYLVEGSVVWFPVSQFEVRGELAYAKTDGFDGTVSGFLRFTRYF
ncbi:hypothetical protein [Mesorhizobium sp. J428]|uniref:hypothetical protein n=1 Tax=Mesorhizobium sp. J428 TaxID=2898440 RepID=UPI002151D8A8|nr:hypothetical protein [Mesorhizobium sp. J428]MCR5859044.1 hypothetical protein [Mesorhizobium sp. J428]